MCEELAALQSLKGTTTGEDIFGKVCQTMEELDLDWSKLASITTDGAPSMVGASRGLIGRMNREMEERGLTALLQVHCLIHQQALCCKVLKWDSVMKVVVSCINFIRAKGLKHRQFQQFLSELESAHGDVLYYTENPFLADIDEAQPSYQFELAELQNCDVLKDAFKPNSKMERDGPGWT
ncbi:hypothetical protein JOQ06_015650, partial [Pogonophryne albipinna]